MEWLEQVRALDAALLSDMGVKVVEHPQLGRALAFPYRRNGDAYAAKFRTVDKKFASSSGVSRGFYNEDALRRLEEEPIIITEGEIDCLSVMQVGYLRAVSIPNGWGKGNTKADTLVEAEEYLRASPYVIVAGDGDEAGESLPRTVSNLLKGHDVRSVIWPAGCKDANDVLVNLGPGALSDALKSARRIDPPGGTITAFSDLPPLGDRRVLRVGAAPFDWAVALELGAFSVWTGTPGSGKSTFLTFVAEKITINEGIRCGMMAFETHPYDIRDQLSLIRTGRDFKSLDDTGRARLLADLDNRFRLVHVTLDGDAPQNLAWLESMIHTLAVRDGCKLIIIDPWNELEHMPEKGESMTSYINFATKFLRQMAEKLDVHIALVAHPRKMPTDGVPRPPNGYDIADSAAFFNKPSLGVTVHQNKFSDKDTGEESKWVEIHTWKVRKTRLYGFEKGMVKVDFNASRMSYEAHKS